MTILGWRPDPAPPKRSAPAPRRRRWVGITIAVTVVLLIAAAAGSALTLDRLASVDHLGLLDDPVVVDAADRACAEMAQKVRSAQPAPDATAAATASAMRRQNAAIEDMVAAMRDLGEETLEGDHPAVAWLADWELLVELREQYADELVSGGHPSLVVPTQDGVPVSERMGEVSQSCEVVATLVPVNE